MCNCSRRAVFALVPFTALALSGCMKQSEGPEEIHYGREVCAMCGMIISDPHFAAEIRGGANADLVKFDDIGDAVNWLKVKGWTDAEVKEFWVMDYAEGKTWLDARKSYYLGGVMSPMNYGFAAVGTAQEGALSFAEMQKRALARGLSSRCIQPDEDNA